jgi:hypothetical protein
VLPGATVDTDRAVNSPPIAARRMSRRTRSTVRQFCTAFATSSSSLTMLSAPIVQVPARRQPAAADDRHRPPALEADAPAVENRRRVGRSTAGARAGQRRTPPPTAPKVKSWPSRKKSRFSGRAG